MLKVVLIICFSPREGIWLVETWASASGDNGTKSFSPREGIWLVET
ncbi:hypothetical protein GXM_09469 [Nostoc sphaeroides CCNUC1]|uniref:Uncharacterized protein n=1 Tax=Nostoc sphaeroides CCNUC1 TaxID=2653204 RepID=A0A5P8WGQ1_9NOSO|nr:hypothetical protein GXM_09469 [Nostoc sphaeroides CCNUC1]